MSVVDKVIKDIATARKSPIQVGDLAPRGTVTQLQYPPAQVVLQQHHEKGKIARGHLQGNLHIATSLRVVLACISEIGPRQKYDLWPHPFPNYKSRRCSALCASQGSAHRQQVLFGSRKGDPLRVARDTLAPQDACERRHKTRALA